MLTTDYTSWPRPVPDPTDALRAEWEEIPTYMLQNLVESSFRRLKVIITAKGRIKSEMGWVTWTYRNVGQVTKNFGPYSVYSWTTFGTLIETHGNICPTVVLYLGSYPIVFRILASIKERQYAMLCLWFSLLSLIIFITNKPVPFLYTNTISYCLVTTPHSFPLRPNIVNQPRHVWYPKFATWVMRLMS